MRDNMYRYIINTFISDPNKAEKTAKTLTEARIKACRLAKARKDNYGYKITIRDTQNMERVAPLKSECRLVEIIHYAQGGYHMEKADTEKWYRVSPVTGRILEKEST